MSSRWRWRLILLGLFAGGFLAVYVPATLVTRSIERSARDEEQRLQRVLLRNLLQARSQSVATSAGELGSHPLARAAPCSEPPGDDAWIAWVAKVAARTGADEVRVTGQENLIVASRLHPEAFGVPMEPPVPTEYDRLAFGSVAIPRASPTLFWMATVPIPNCPWLEARLLWNWTPEQGTVAPFDSTAQAAFTVRSADGRGLATLMLSGGPPRTPAAWAGRMILPSLAGGLIVLLAGWILLLPQRRAWGRVEKEAEGAWRRVRGLSEEGGKQAPPVADLLRFMSEEAGELAARAERLADVAGWRDVGRAIGHEVRNALTPLRLTVGTLALRSGDDPALQEGLRSAQLSLERVQRLVEEFSNFARLPEAKLRAEDVRALAREGAEAWALAGPPDVAVRAAAEPLRARADAGLLGHVLRNLLKNAREAAGPDGRVELSCEPRGDHVRITVWNSGAPIPEGLLETIFQGGLSTKAGGNGLGLAIARELTQRMRGRIFAENTRDGVAFHIELPVAGGAK